MHGWWFMAHGSRLMAHDSWTRKGCGDPGLDLGLRPYRGRARLGRAPPPFFCLEPWAMSLQPWAMNHTTHSTCNISKKNVFKYPRGTSILFCKFLVRVADTPWSIHGVSRWVGVGWVGEGESSQPQQESQRGYEAVAFDLYAFSY